ncbi:BlaI/MecI/CopY family transcriptional regulator [Catelliglobosispora koreensis]|uniref:BlaI/MecI/CopY family transcriptional regulator n=1 Tax=Catelliglobosispora koreensis TaxID=129052 RepID=UPI0004774AFC|nr:BlaI/MecI/CopY family transcriptional regulator [Catelliglobosispora koreensis]
MLNLGQLETKVMDVLWDSPGEPLRVRDIMDRLGDVVARAYTTVITVLDSLHRKGWVVLHTEGRGYVYPPAKNREEAAADALLEVLESAADSDAVLPHFARTASDDEAGILRRGLRRRTNKPSS